MASGGALYHQRKAQGHCVDCGEPNPEAPHIRCPACKDRVNYCASRLLWNATRGRKKRQDRYYGRKAQGLCVKCGLVEAVPDHVYCATCATPKKPQALATS